MKPILEDPLFVYLFPDDFQQPPPWRSHPGRGWCVGSFDAVVDAEWDRPRPSMPRRLWMPQEDEAGIPFWAQWTAREALYKRIWRRRRFVPADFPVKGWRQAGHPSALVHPFFFWDGGFSACIRLPGHPPLWVSAAFLS